MDASGPGERELAVVCREESVSPGEAAEVAGLGRVRERYEVVTVALTAEQTRKDGDRL